MREIKFRAWNKQTRRMEDVRQINFFDSEMLNGNSEWYSLRHTELLQYTGLQDKNGIEIYEGDIVSWKNKDEDTLKYAKVFFEDGAFRLYNTYFELKSYENLAVIGNIYENPKLLENEK